MTDPERDGTATAVPRSDLYRRVWRWHFYAGLLSIPVIVLLCLTGIVYLFRPQLDDLVYGNLRNVTPVGAQVSYQQQLMAVRRAYPGGTVDMVAVPPTPRRSTQFDITTASGGSESVYVNPYTGRVVGARDNSTSLTQIALELHGSLMTAHFLGTQDWGDRLIEIVAGWSVVLVVSGVYLWWPRGARRRRGLRGVLRPRWRHRSRRIAWRDVHAVTGVLFGFVTLFFLVTGMMWTGVWGTKYSQVAAKLNADYPSTLINGVSSTSLASLPKRGKVPWASSTLPVPLSGEQGNPATHGQHHGFGRISWDARTAAPLDAVVARAQRMGFGTGLTIFMPADETGSFTLSHGFDLDPTPDISSLDGRTAFLDQYTAAPLADVNQGDYGAMAKVSDYGISLHEGREWGLTSQLIMLAATLAILISCASAMVMWRKRRPRGLGAPRRAPQRRLLVGVTVITLALGVLFPLLGMSILAVLVLDMLVIRRIPPVGRALGAR